VAAKPEPVEEVVDPDRVVVDPHHHLWGPHHDLTPSRYLLDDLLADTGSGHRVAATVYVEAHSHYRKDGPERLRPVGETEFANSMADLAVARELPTAVAAGIVGKADLSLGDQVDEVLQAHCLAAPERFRGVRDGVNPPNDTLVDVAHRLQDPAYRQGVARLAAFGLTYDALVFHFQLGELLEVVRAVPEVTFVINHLGSPIGVKQFTGKRDEYLPQWRTDLTALAAEPNTVMKLGGLNMYLTGFLWHKREQKPSSDELLAATGDWYRFAIDTFGPTRAMFESNFPPDKLSGSYRTLWNLYKKVAAAYSEDEQDALLRGTASRVYRL
jgi:predicted TIM-barrel fold metal-dependent hydrolase